MRISDWSSDVLLFRSRLGVERQRGGPNPRPFRLQVVGSAEGRQHQRILRIADATRATRQADLDGVRAKQLQKSGRLEGLSPTGPQREVGVGTIDHAQLGRAHPAGTVVVLAAQRGRQLEPMRSEEHTSELQSLMRISYAVFCLKKT